MEILQINLKHILDKRYKRKDDTMNKIKISIVLGIMCFALTFGIFLQIKTVENSNMQVSQNYEENNLRAEVLKFKEKYDNKLKEVEKAGFPIVQMCNLIPVAKTVGSNRIVPTISIPYPLGDPATTKEEQWKLRYHRTKVAVESLAADITEQTVFKV